MNNELERMLKKAFMAQFGALFQNFCEEKNHKSIRIGGGSGSDLNWAHPEYKLRALPLELTCLVIIAQVMRDKYICLFEFLYQL